jgi:hypothetical protein
VQSVGGAGAAGESLAILQGQQHKHYTLQAEQHRGCRGPVLQCCTHHRVLGIAPGSPQHHPTPPFTFWTPLLHTAPPALLCDADATGGGRQVLMSCSMGQHNGTLNGCHGGLPVEAFGWAHSRCTLAALSLHTHCTLPAGGCTTTASQTRPAGKQCVQ